MSNNKLALTASTLTNALGQGQAATLSALREQRGGLRKCDFDAADLDTWIGRVDGIEEVTLPATLQRFDCRNNRLALLALEQDAFTDALGKCRQRYGARRIGVFLGTSTSGIQATELADRFREPDSGRLPDRFDLQTTQLPLFAPTPEPVQPTPQIDPVIDALDTMDPDALTPRQALEALYSLKKLRDDT